MDQILPQEYREHRRHPRDLMDLIPSIKNTEKAPRMWYRNHHAQSSVTVTFSADEVLKLMSFPMVPVIDNLLHFILLFITNQLW